MAAQPIDGMSGGAGMTDPVPITAVIGAIRRDRAALLCGTALGTALLLVVALPAAAQPAPNARPMGGQVIAGQATIGTSGNVTSIIQGSNRAAIDWQGFDIGANQSVRFAQPSANAVTLNQVVGPDPSQIAGRISANGQIVLMNQSGVVFFPGAQVNAAGLVASAAGMSDPSARAFVAGTQGTLGLNVAARVGAKVVNRGSITLKQAGLAALVAPQVANLGTIRAPFGHVVLAGAEAATVDLYGDGLLSIDVTAQVTRAPAGVAGKPVPALVTNQGTILADGGTVLLSAAAADGIVQTLVTAGGRIRADSIGARRGTIEIAGTGGSVLVEGTLDAAGHAPGSQGGLVAVNTTGTVTVARHARIDASGRAGGGVVALGTTLARAEGGPAVASTQTARAVTIARGARISADASVAGNGGRVTLLSTQMTDDAGHISARGGWLGGNGGSVEVSGVYGLHVTGAIDTGAPHGHAGSILFDPLDLTIGANGSDNGLVNAGTVTYGAGGQAVNAYISPAAFTSFIGTVDLQATRDLFVTAPITMANPNQGLTLEAGRNLAVAAGANINVNGAVTLAAGRNFNGHYAGLGSMTIAATVASTGGFGTVQLIGGANGITLGPAAVVSGYSVRMSATGGGIAETGGKIVANYVSSSIYSGGGSTGVVGGVSLTGANEIRTIRFFTTTGDFHLNDVIPLNVYGTLQAGAGATLGLTAPAIRFQTGEGGPSELFVPALPGSVPRGGTIALQTDTLSIGSQYSFVSGTRILAPSGTVAIAPLTQGLGVSLAESGGGLLLNASDLGAIATSTLVVGSIPGGTGPSAGTITIAETGGLTIAGTLANTLELDATGPVGQSVPLTVATLTGTAGSFAMTNRGNAVATLGNLVASGSLAVADSAGLTVAGTLSGASATLTSYGAITVVGGVSAATGVLLSSAGDLSVPGTISAGSANLFAIGGSLSISGLVAVAGTLSLGALGFGGIDAPGTIDAGTLSAGTLGAARFTGPNAIGTLSGFNVPLDSFGSLVLNDTVPLTISGDISFPAQISLTVTGGITQAPSSHIVTGTLSGSASGPVSLTGANRIVTLAGFTVGSGDFALVDTEGLTIAGPLGAANASLSVAGDLTLAANVTVPGTLDLAATGTILRTAGTLSAGTLTGQAGTLADFGAGVQLGTLGAFTVADGSFALGDAGALTIAGLLSANFLQVSSVGQMTLSGDIATLGSPLASQEGAQPAAGGSDLRVLADGGGGAVFVQTGTSDITALGGGRATLRIDVSAAGGIERFAGLVAPSVDLVLATGTGQSSGTIDVGGLLVLGAGGEATLFGQVDGIPGKPAASVSNIAPAIDFAYLMNECVIGLPVCVPPSFGLLTQGVLGGLTPFLPGVPPPTLTLPTLNLVALPALPAPPGRLTDPDVVPPNISNQDY